MIQTDKQLYFFISCLQLLVFLFGRLSVKSMEKKKCGVFLYFYRLGNKVKNRGEIGPDTLLEGAAELVDAELPNTERG